MLKSGYLQEREKKNEIKSAPLSEKHGIRKFFEPISKFYQTMCTQKVSRKGRTSMSVKALNPEP